MDIATRYRKQARRMVDESGKRRIDLELFRKRLPELARQIESESGSPLLELWGHSRNVDSNARRTIVHPKLVTAIGRLAGTRIRFDSAFQAGLMHTYGYLLSWIETPYGYKGDRWAEGKIQRGLGLPAGCLSGQPKRGTLLGNLSYVLGRIVVPRELDRLIGEKGHPTVDQRLLDFTISERDAIQIEERVSGRGGNSGISMWTRLIPFKKKKSGSLLVYSIQTGKTPLRLITCFPIESDVHQRLANAGPTGQQMVMLTHNAWVSGLGRSPVKGNRVVRHL